MRRFAFCPLFCIPLAAAIIPADLSGVRPGPVTATATASSVLVSWPDETGRPWTAEFSLDDTRPLLRAIAGGGKPIVEQAAPLYWASTGKRRGGWDQFFDFPPSHPDGTRSFTGQFRPRSLVARTIGDRLEVFADGLALGIFSGGIAYTFYPGSRLVQQEAVVRTSEPDTAYYYDAGFRWIAESDRRPGGNMESKISYYDTGGRLATVTAEGPERTAHRVRHRTVAARTAGGTIAVFPAPHQYFFARDFTSNMSHLWSRSWRGQVALGIRQLPDDNTAFYPWANAPPGTAQRLGLFLWLSTGDDARATIDEVLRLTNRDRYPALSGYKTLAAHWHVAYTVQAQEYGMQWTPPFKPVLKDMGVDAAMIADFHGDGHPRDPGQVRLSEVEAYYKACRAQSDAQFLLIPSEEANVHYGGHWAVAFPRPVHWIMSRPEGNAFATPHPTLGTVYRVGTPEEMLDLIRREKGIAYQTHPRTKGSMGFPDKIRETAWFRDATYIGTGWKAMPSDHSTLRQGLRALNLLDDMNNWGMPKVLLGEVDVFQIDSTHELYAHMNVNYVRMDRLPDFDNYGRVLETIQRGDYFVSSGEVLLPESRIEAGSGQSLRVRAGVRWTFPLAFAQVVWGDGDRTTHKTIALDTTRPFGSHTFDWTVEAPGWKWARLELWDVAGNGAFTTPVRR